jgi:hypothetical protein
MVCCFHKVNKLYNGTLNSIHSYSFIAITLDMSNNEVFTYTKAMQQPNSVQFIEAMTKELYDHESRNHWEIVCRSTIPPGHKTIQAVWSFKRKHFPYWSLNKHKVRLCAHGGMQQWGVSYWETYSPMVNMLMVCLLLALCNIHSLESNPSISSWHFLKPTSTRIFGWTFPWVSLLQINPTNCVPMFSN